MTLLDRRPAQLAWLALLLTILLGCGSAPPPKELRNARSAYEAAQQGAAAKYAPAELDTAKQALERAEGAFEEEPEEQRTLDLAYIAERRAQLAEVKAGVVRAERIKSGAEKAYKATTEEELDRARKQVHSGQQMLAAERQARVDAERQLKAAMLSLEKIAAVKEEARGMVITLSGAVLFASGKSTLLPIAREKLNQVAKTLKDQGSPKLVVEGHTDATGSHQLNMRLSQQRADAVRRQLVSQGYPGGKVSAVGIGPVRPVAENRSPEGRANNRRVEIIVSK